MTGLTHTPEDQPDREDEAQCPTCHKVFTVGRCRGQRIEAHTRLRQHQADTGHGLQADSLW